MSDEFDVKKLAQMARLELSEEEVIELQKELPSILDYISKLQEVDTSNFEATAYLTDEFNRFREDAVVDSEDRKDAIESFPEKTGNSLKVPGVF